LYPLPASKSALERAQSEPGAAARMRTRHYYYPNRGTHFSPAGEIGQTPYVQSAMELLNYQGSDGQ
jgi:hypothetical protein